MGRLAKHIGFGEDVEIDGEHYLLKPLTTDALPMYFKAMKAFKNVDFEKKELGLNELLSGLDDEGLEAIKWLIDKTLEVSLPDEPKEDRAVFGMKYMMVLFGKIMELNSYVPKNSEDSKVQKMREHLSK